MVRVAMVVAGLHNSRQPGSQAARKWRENEKNRRKWKEHEEIERFTLYIFANVTKNLTYAL